MKPDAITERCEKVLIECLDELLEQGREIALGKRLEVVTKATRYLESVTPKVTHVSHSHDRGDAETHA